MGGVIMAKVSKVERKVKKKRFGFILLLLLFIIALFLLISLKTNWLYITQIQVSGNKRTKTDKILKAAGAIKNENIFKFNRKTVEKNVKSLPYIKEVKIKRKLPNKVIISVKEREEKLFMSYSGSLTYLDKDGYILSIEDKKKEDDYIEILGPQIGKLEVGDNLFDSYDEFKRLKGFVKLSNEANILKDFDKIDVRDENNIILRLKVGTKVSFGDFSNMKYKLSFLDSIVKDMDEKEIYYEEIYLNKGENPIIVTETD